MPPESRVRQLRTNGNFELEGWIMECPRLGQQRTPRQDAGRIAAFRALRPKATGPLKAIKRAFRFAPIPVIPGLIRATQKRSPALCLEGGSERQHAWKAQAAPSNR